jgi:epsilon-lactone hydrolase
MGVVGVRVFATAVAVAALAAGRASAQAASGQAATSPQATSPTEDGAWFDPDGTAHITRVVPSPGMISPEAQQWLKSLADDPGVPEGLAARRAFTDQWRARDSAEALKRYPVKISERYIAGVRTDLITPLRLPDQNRKRVFINLHGGGFNSDSGSLIEGDPIANLAQTQVVSVYYRLAPEHPFPAAVDDVIAVYKELLKTHKPGSIGVFGTSAGATLTCEVAVQLKQSGLPLPGALGIFSGSADFSRVSDSRQFFTNNGLPGHLSPTDPAHLTNDAYVGSTDRRNPLLSPLYADLKGMPPSLLISSTRDAGLGDTTTLHRALLHAGVDARLVVFEALPHAFWYHFEFPETHEALQLMAQFLDQTVAR